VSLLRSSHKGAVDLDRQLYRSPDAPVRIVEYGDFECSCCRRAAPVLKQLVDGSGGRVALVWRHFPLFTVHAFALTAALAAEASGEHGLRGVGVLRGLRSQSRGRSVPVGARLLHVRRCDVSDADRGQLRRPPR
jgi:hypothetical protein